jgi:hypothetical protein
MKYALDENVDLRSMAACLVTVRSCSTTKESHLRWFQGNSKRYLCLGSDSVQLLRR